MSSMKISYILYVSGTVNRAYACRVVYFISRFHEPDTCIVDWHYHSSINWPIRLIKRPDTYICKHKQSKSI